jgi:hypothetical protein
VARNCHVLPDYEVAERHDPRDLQLQIRALATVAVRNGSLEDLHLDDHIEQWEWRDVTRAAANALAGFADAGLSSALAEAKDPSRDSRRLPDRDGGIHGALRTAPLRRGRMAAACAPKPPAGDDATPLTPRGEEILHATDERISLRTADGLAYCAEHEQTFSAPSLKHISGPGLPGAAGRGDRAHRACGGVHAHLRRGDADAGARDLAVRAVGGRGLQRRPRAGGQARRARAHTIAAHARRPDPPQAETIGAANAPLIAAQAEIDIVWC